MHVFCVLFYELSKADVIGAEFADPVEDADLTGVNEGQVLGHLCGKQTVRVGEETRGSDMVRFASGK